MARALQRRWEAGCSPKQGGTAAERQLLNVVAEMALAARIAPPQVFVLPGERSINAFAAGLTPQTAALGMTGGALATLNRDELQAVVAHEFSHIVNGDMALNTRLVAWLHGLTVMTNLARRMRGASARDFSPGTCISTPGCSMSSAASGRSQVSCCRLPFRAAVKSWPMPRRCSSPVTRAR